jgi:hypothetical protein
VQRDDIVKQPNPAGDKRWRSCLAATIAMLRPHSGTVFVATTHRQDLSSDANRSGVGICRRNDGQDH